MPGKAILELVEYKDVSFRATPQPKIKHDRPITICFWFSSVLLVTGGMDNSIALWNMAKVVKIT